ncbi:hypothetical protein BABINDRAFT_163833 [Babjeviella inositovora NRRL Y-12698]|uniref:EKC/KEOPS complex subunit CGI121 n=1 Tax=Babjeviella inositovora NRRL Y-12698 TaxID=984486 RepID=A0A1E3QHB6_9ASCO|nr:uncharacterized protein BABINDRAFT_163833 [Babjeviella inositovora NRRL Y-12698]ODQ77103.1 hypothetical protein BABINDRAFT_163833 [Babjeviella inositovora NRRL Y-12698]
MSPVTLSFPQFPECSVHVTVWCKISNTAAIKQQLMEGNQNYGHFAFINSDMVTSKAHLYSAIYRTLTNQVNGTMTSRNLNSEATISLSMNNKKITDNLKKFGINEHSERIIVLEFFEENGVDHCDSLKTLIEGEEAEFTDAFLRAHINWGELIKVYKLDKNKEMYYKEEQNREELFNVLNGSIQLNGF